jgi:hypothetical protein
MKKKRVETTKLTVRLPREEIAHAKAYAESAGLTLTEVISRYFRRLRALEPSDLHPDVREVVGLIPPDADLDALREEYLREKHLR